VRGGSVKLNGPRGAFAWQQVGKDSQGYGDPIVPAAPALDSTAYAIELVELYWASLLRDVPLAPLPSMLMAIPLLISMPVKAVLVNWLP
jgi:hypothetical protein